MNISTKHADRGGQFPIGAAVTLDELDRDPYPIYARLRDAEPVSWIPVLNMWFVTRYDLVREILMDTDGFIVGSEESLLQDTFGEHMLTTEGELHDRYRSPPIQSAFSPRSARENVEEAIRSHVQRLIDGFVAEGAVDLRPAFASRLPIQTMLSVFGLDLENEQAFRHWYDSFEAALANFGWEDTVRNRAADCVGEFHELLQGQIEKLRKEQDTSLLSLMMRLEGGPALTDEEIRRNTLLIFFGGISTVEALILNTLYALLTHPDVLSRVQADRSSLSKALDETMRWLGPVQSATRHVVAPRTIAGVEFAVGDTVNCMLAAANRDPEAFDRPDEFDIDRPGLSKHVGFASGPHFCLGKHLAKLEATIAIEALLDRLSDLQMAPGSNISPVGHEFRQPKAFPVVWRS